MKLLIIGEPNPNSHLRNSLKTFFPGAEFSLAFDAASFDQSLSQDGYDLVFIEKPLDQLSSPDLLHRLHHTRAQLPPVLVSAFEQTEVTFRTMLESLPDWLEWLGTDSRYQFISSACETITGFRPEEFIANPKLILSLVHPDDRQRVTAHRQEMVEHSNRACEFEFRLYHRNGELHWISHKCRPLFREGVWVGNFAVNRDISESKKAAEELNLSNQALLTLMNAPEDVVILVDREYKIVQVNQTLADRFGKRIDELVGKKISEVLPLGSDLARTREQLARQVFETGQPARSEDVGVSGVFDNAYFPVLDEQGQVRLVAVIARDITQRKQVENELRQSYQTIQTLLNAPSDIAAVFDMDGRIQMANETLASVLKHSVSALTGKIIWDYFPAEMSQYRKAVVEKVKRTKKPERIVDHGITGHYDSIVLPFLDENGEVNRIAILARDIGERVKAQEELRHSKDELQVILDGVAETIAVLNQQGELVYINQAGLQLTGYRSLEALVGDVGRPDLLYMRDEAGNSISWEDLRRLKVFRGAVKGSSIFRLLPLNSDQERWISTQSTPILDDKGELQFIVIIAHDLTDLKRTQTQLEAAQVELEKKIAERTSELNLANQELVQRVAERQRAAAHSEALAHVAARVNIQTDLPSTLQAICEEITRAVNYHYCSIFLYDEQRDEFRLATPSTQDENPAQVSATPRALYEHYLRMYGPVIVIPDRQALPETHDAQMMVQYDVRTLISVPLISNGELIGNLNVASANEVRLPSAEELSLLVALADQASIAISKARLFEQVSESRTRLKFLSEKLVEIQEAERRNLARELHDEIGQLLTSLRLNLDLAIRAMPTSQLTVEEAQKQLTRANETATQLLGRIREISLDLRPTLLDDLGLLPALLVQFERFTAQTNIQVHFKHSGLENRCSSQIETVAFRVVQEALTNVTRHAQTKEVYVRLWKDAQCLRLQVEDHGVGFDPQVALASNLTSGLSGMQERVSLCNGQFEIESEPGQGTCLTIELPLK